MKKLIVLIVVFSILFGVNSYAQTKFYTTEQVMNKVLNTSENTLKTTISGGSLEVTTTTVFTNTVFKRYTLTAGVDSGVNLDFGTEVDSWVILNMADTADVFIKFDAPAALTDFRIQAGSGVGGSSKVTNIHCITSGVGVEVQAIGYYN
jgi:hypothetical protein